MRIERNQSLLTHLLLAGVLLVIFVWSAIGPRDRFTWVLEVAPGVLGAIVLTVIYPRFRFTTLVYTLILIHASILFVGGHYTYAEVPAFNWLRDTYHLSRNHFDRIGHFAQGFVPAMIAREVLLQTSPLKRGKWLIAIVIAFCLAISAMYELFEWAVAALTGESADAFLATQGDPFDTQKDMCLAFMGAIVALLLLSGWQDRQLRRLLEPASSQSSAATR